MCIRQDERSGAANYGSDEAGCGAGRNRAANDVRLHAAELHLFHLARKIETILAAPATMA